MKKLLIICLFLMVGLVAQAEGLTLTGGLSFDWLDITQIERDVVIDNYQKELFKDDTVYKFNRKEFKKEHKDFLKDKNFNEHYLLIKDGVKETKDENLCAFYYKDTLLVSYAVQLKKDMKKTYYYDAFGNLRYIDILSDNYPKFPYYSKQYRANGTLVSAIYFISHDMQYMYENDQKFKGAWYKDRMYDRHAKQVLTRTNW